MDIREVLRHLWLRGVDGMQVYNAIVPGYEHMALAEVEDALSVYAEMNAFGELLRGESLNLEIPPPQSDAALWSGRWLVDRAVIRTFKPGGGEAQVQVEAWPGHPVTLSPMAIGGHTGCVSSGRAWRSKRFRRAERTAPAGAMRPCAAGPPPGSCPARPVDRAGSRCGPWPRS